jgi:hypothetical protein
MAYRRHADPRQKSHTFSDSIIKQPPDVVARLAAFAKASAAERIRRPGVALAETGPGDPVFQRRLFSH